MSTRHFILFLAASSRPSSLGGDEEQLSYVWAPGHGPGYLPLVLRPADTIRFVLAADPMDGWPRDQLLLIDPSQDASLELALRKLPQRSRPSTPPVSHSSFSGTWLGTACDFGSTTVQPLRGSNEKRSWGVRLTVTATPLGASEPCQFTVDPEMVVGNWEEG